MIGEVQGDTPIAFAERLDADPDHFARGGDRIEIGRVVDLEARRQNLGFQNRCRKRSALQLLVRIEQGVGAAAAADNALPRGREPAERGGGDGFDFVPQLCQRPAAEAAQHFRIAPLAPARSVRVARGGQRGREELALQHPLLVLFQASHDQP